MGFKRLIRSALGDPQVKQLMFFSCKSDLNSRRPRPDQHSGLQGFDVIMMSASSIDHQLSDSHPEWRKRFHDGHQMLAFRDIDTNSIKSYLWFTNPSLGAKLVPWELAWSIKVDSSLSYIWDCRTLPESQGKGLYTTGLDELIYTSHSQQKLPIIYCAVENVASQKGIVRSGFKPLGTVTLFKVGRLNIQLGCFGFQFSLGSPVLDLVQKIALVRQTLAK
jgi:hypothetical protein